MKQATPKNIKITLKYMKADQLYSKEKRKSKYTGMPFFTIKY